jgi:hypothetical protein
MGLIASFFTRLAFYPSCALRIMRGNSIGFYLLWIAAPLVHWFATTPLCYSIAVWYTCAHEYSA